MTQVLRHTLLQEFFWKIGYKILLAFCKKVVHLPKTILVKCVCLSTSVNWWYVYRLTWESIKKIQPQRDFKIRSFLVASLWQKKGLLDKTSCSHVWFQILFTFSWSSWVDTSLQKVSKFDAKLMTSNLHD